MVPPIPEPKPQLRCSVAGQEGEAGMLYTAQVDLDGDDLAAGIARVRAWLERHQLDPRTFQYRVGAKAVRLRIDFTTLPDAAAFAQAFGGLVLGIREATQAAD